MYERCEVVLASAHRVSGPCEVLLSLPLCLLTITAYGWPQLRSRLPSHLHILAVFWGKASNVTTRLTTLSVTCDHVITNYDRLPY